MTSFNKCALRETIFEVVKHSGKQFLPTAYILLFIHVHVYYLYIWCGAGGYIYGIIYSWVYDGEETPLNYTGIIAVSQLSAGLFTTGCHPLVMDPGHRRRINTEEKAKVVAAAWRTELIQFLAALAILHQDDQKKIHPILHIVLVQFILFSKSS